MFSWTGRHVKFGRSMSVIISAGEIFQEKYDFSCYSTKRWGSPMKEDAWREPLTMSGCICKIQTRNVISSDDFRGLKDSPKTTVSGRARGSQNGSNKRDHSQISDSQLEEDHLFQERAYEREKMRDEELLSYKDWHRTNKAADSERMRRQRKLSVNKMSRKRWKRLVALQNRFDERRHYQRN
ncbi:hypothetical protein COOONC_11059 [Cooperia oncophora]